MYKSKIICFLKTMLMVVILATFSGCGGCDGSVPTTRDRTIVPDDISSSAESIFPYEIAKYAPNGYGKWHYGPGLDSVKRLDIMSTTYSEASVTNNKQLLNFFTVADIHITDKESPAQAIATWERFTSSAYSGTMLYSMQFLNAAVETINSLHNDNAFDFGISLGDSSNSKQGNETRWYIDVLDGKTINPSSGAHAGADTIDYQKPFQATGLDKSIPWYQAIGNHDHFWMGFWPVDNYIVQQSSSIGEDIISLGAPFFTPENYYVGVIDGSTPYGDIIGLGKISDFPTPPKVIADPARRFLSKKEWMTEFLTTTSTPVGHGFTQTNVDEDFACYSFVPKSNMPIKIIVLDDTQSESDPYDPSSIGYAHGELDTPRYDWLVNELNEGQAAGQLMIIAAHIPIGVEPAPSSLGWNATFESNLIAKLHTYPNFILWIAGHRHYNTVTAFKSPDDAHPELGFWQVETSSLKDFPQQFRTFEIFRNSDNNISVLTTDVDPVFDDGSLANISRTYGVAAQQIYGNEIDLLPTGSYNAELVKQLSPEMQEKLKNL